MFIRRYRQTGSIARRPGSGPKSKITSEIMQVVERQMRLDDETTAMQLHRLLEEKGYSMSRRTVLRCCTALGWTSCGSEYCQLIRQTNKEKRLQWARSCLDSEDDFVNVIWCESGLNQDVSSTTELNEDMRRECGWMCGWGCGRMCWWERGRMCRQE